MVVQGGTLRISMPRCYAATTSTSLINLDNVFAPLTTRIVIGSARPRIATSCSGKPSTASPALTRTSSEMTASNARLFVMAYELARITYAFAHGLRQPAEEAVDDEIRIERQSLFRKLGRAAHVHE